jgi:pimeloyl-ACP methyl ester carboxylesterase
MIQYAKNGDVHIAYQVVGEGPPDLVYITGAVGNLRLWWEEPGCRRFLERLASFSRVILFDKRGMGLSDRGNFGTLEDRMDDMRAILDAVGSERAAFFGLSEGGPLAVLFAATYPERTQGLILYGAEVKEETTPDSPWGMERERSSRSRWPRFSTAGPTAARTRTSSRRAPPKTSGSRTGGGA